MKVNELIKKLQKCDPEANVYFPNCSLYVDGYFLCDTVDSDPEKNLVYLDANYNKRLASYDD